MFDFAGYAAAIRKHLVLFVLTLFVVAVFGAAPFLALYRKAKQALPAGVGDKLPAK